MGFVRYAPAVSDSGVRLSDLLVAMSLATDLGFGQPVEHMLRSARIGMRLGERLGLDASQMATLYDVSLLTYVGCPTYGNEAAKVFGDDIDFRADALQVDLAGFPAMLFMLRRAGSGRSALHRALEAAAFMATGGHAVVEQMASHCSAAGALADRLGLGADVRAGIEQAYARWDGRGVPDTLSGTGLSLAARISHVAEACEVFERTGGVDAAADMLRSRSGTHFDPQIATAAATDPGSLFDGINDNTVEEIAAAEPIERSTLSDDELDAALEAIGDFCDLRCPFFTGHARGTAALAAAGAELLHMPRTEARLVYRAALVHDIGRFGVDASVWAQAGPLSATQRERMRLHVYFVERIFDRPRHSEGSACWPPPTTNAWTVRVTTAPSVPRCSPRRPDCWRWQTPITRCGNHVLIALHAAPWMRERGSRPTRPRDDWTPCRSMRCCPLPSTARAGSTPTVRWG